MSLLFETIQITDGKAQRPDYHEARMIRSSKELFGTDTKICLREQLAVPEQFSKGIIKCRVEYGPDIENITFSNYVKREIKSLKLIENNEISYPYKFTDRQLLNSLREKRGETDEILIVKNGLITDTSFTNIAFFDGGHWFTPDSPLLPGTMRSYLLYRKVLIEQRITPSLLNQFSCARLLNAMLSWEGSTEIPVSNIYG